jgi:hypothetical protein
MRVRIAAAVSAAAAQPSPPPTNVTVNFAGFARAQDELAQLVQERDYVGDPRTPRPLAATAAVSAAHQSAFNAIQNAILSHGMQMNLDNAVDADEIGRAHV